MVIPPDTSVAMGLPMTINATSEAAIATTIDSNIRGTSYPIGTGRWKASMPTKCMLQMPRPITVAAPASQPSRVVPDSERTRPARSSAANDASIATTTERTTRNVL